MFEFKESDIRPWTLDPRPQALDQWAVPSKKEVWRSAVSVAANVVEGSARKSKNEYLQFLYIAMSSLAELSYYIRFTKELEYLDTKTYEELWEKAQEAVRTLQGLISYVEKSGI